MEKPISAISTRLADDLKYAHWNGEKWVRKTLDDEERVGLYTSIALRSGNPRISYYDITNRSIKYAVLLRLLLESEDHLPLRDLRTVFLHRPGQQRQPPHQLLLLGARRTALRQLDWQRMVNHGGRHDGDTGKYSSLAIGSNDIPHISYFFDETVKKVWTQIRGLERDPMDLSKP